MLVGRGRDYGIDDYDNVFQLLSARSHTIPELLVDREKGFHIGLPENTFHVVIV